MENGVEEKRRRKFTPLLTEIDLGILLRTRHFIHKSGIGIKVCRSHCRGAPYLCKRYESAVV